jgi:predicted acetyltransferase
MGAADIRLVRVPAADKDALWAVMADYLTEHARRVEPDRDYEPGGYPHFDAYWSEPERHPYWIEQGDQRAGFVLVSPHSPSELGTDHSISEFCILPPWRRSGVGLAAAKAALSAHPGLWELQVYRGNPDGMPFWPKAIAAAAARELELIERDDRVIYRFRIEP